jgi:hypothetical protein
MRSTILCTLLFSVLVAAPLPAECPCFPLTHVWVVRTCTDWNCASTELMLGGGDPQVMAIPCGMDNPHWLVLRRIAAGSAIDVGTDPFELRQFDEMDSAVTHYATLTRERLPMMLTAPDGQVLVLSLKQGEPRKRAAAH